jgi:hypothetical protein
MTEFSLDTSGFESAIEEVNDLIDDVQTGAEFVVGTGVNYAVFLEGGTSKMDAKPFFQPALNEVTLQGVDGFIAHNTETTVEALGTLKQVLAALALAIERRVKEIITTKGLIDTGTLRASVLAIPGDDPSPLPGVSEFSGFDSQNPAPPTAGKALVDTVEIET